MIAVIYKTTNMTIHFNVASSIDKCKKEFFILPCLLLSSTTLPNYQRISIAFIWLILGMSIEFEWNKNE